MRSRSRRSLKAYSNRLLVIIMTIVSRKPEVGAWNYLLPSIRRGIHKYRVLV